MILFSRQQDDVMSSILEEALDLAIDEIRVTLETAGPTEWKGYASRIVVQRLSSVVE